MFPIGILSILALLAIYPLASSGVKLEQTTAVNGPTSKDAGGEPRARVGGGGSPPAQKPPGANEDGNGDNNSKSVVYSSFRQDTTLVNNGCIYQNGMVTENGKTRKATAEDEAKVQEYLANQRRYQEKMRKKMEEDMKLMFSAPPFGQNMGPAAPPPFPQMMPPFVMPETPCLCASCRDIPPMNSQLLQGFNNFITEGTTQQGKK